MDQLYYKCKKILSKQTTRLLILLLVFIGVFLGCASEPITYLSKTRKIFVPELDGEVYISSIQYVNEKQVFLTQTHTIKVYDDTKRIAIFSIQLQNVKKKKEYELTPIVLLDGDKRILPDAVKYFSGNSVTFSHWEVESRNFLSNSMKMKGRRKGKYTVNLLYAVDINKEVTGAELFGQVIEFGKEQVRLDIINKFN